MKRTTRNPHQSKKWMVEKSAAVFNMHGYAGTTVQMLVDATGYQAGGIYRHFNGKGDLAKEVFRYSFETMIRPNLKVNRTLSASEQLFSILANYKKMVVSPLIPGGCPILNTSSEVDDTDEAFRKIVNDCVEEVLSLVTGILEDGKQEGVFYAHLDSRKEATFLFSCVEGALFLGKTTKSATTIMGVFDRIEQYIRTSLMIA